MSQNNGKVFLVGAGPGDPKLITVKGMQCITDADVIIYDRLVNPTLLNYAKSEVELVYAGKSPGRHALTQDEINLILAQKAREGKSVVRLKGGDPFVFGRGGEEVELLAKHGIPYEIVPGITSAIAAPEYAGIPVTHRSYASSFAIITGHEADVKDNQRISWDKVAKGADTLVFLMGMRNLPVIVEGLMEHGRDGNEPIALIRWGTTPEQKTLVGTLADIVAKAEAEKFASPAVIVVGEVVTLREKLMWFEQKSLFGKRIIVTRATRRASALADKISALGGEAWEFPTIEIVPPLSFAQMDEAINCIETYQWIIFTSVNGVQSFFDRLKYLRRDVRDLKGIKLCAIGPRTQAEIERFGLIVDSVPKEYRAEAIVEGLSDKIASGERILLPRAETARQLLPQALSEKGVVVDEVTAYRTIQGEGNVQWVTELLQSKRAHAVTFTSSSTVTNFVNMLNADNLSELLQDVVVASIGPITSQTTQELGIHVDVEAKEYTIDGLIAALLEYFSTCRAV
ncbi:TPA: uroporphyrinogen-III C-methyltransferase [Candidatus Poribacteria bacterium]|nr:uroporphyrinogen-III C-methyltransferase [Candidatus Poribacteria bacterium]